MRQTPENMEKLREARRNLAQVEELHTVVLRLLKDTAALLVTIEGTEGSDTDPGSAHPFTRR
jgi:hypothetical protein